MPAVISAVKKGSIADDLGLKQGDQIISVDKKLLRDFFDYREFVFSEEFELHILHADGSEELIEIEKDFDEDLGISFESAVFDKIMPCANRCVFCFVDQQPGGLRQSLYIKDDDYRLSYLHGTYITLTNLKKSDRERIEKYRPGPLYVSVHTTNPDLRKKMLNNPKAGDILKELNWLNSLEIPIHAQIVLCPGYNDGQELTDTLNELGKLKSNILSIAVVPVGLTKYRNVTDLKRVGKQKACTVISQIEKFNTKMKTELAFASDEFYILAEKDFPKYGSYKGFPQLDDGVGTCRLLENDFKKHKKKLPESLKKPKNITIATGQIAINALKPVADELNKIKNLKLSLIPIKSNFWGNDITVSGLVTGEDLIKTLLNEHVETLVIPSVMLKSRSDEFLDGYTVSDIKKALNCTVKVIQDYYSTKELIEFIKI